MGPMVLACSLNWGTIRTSPTMLMLPPSCLVGGGEDVHMRERSCTETTIRLSVSSLIFGSSHLYVTSGVAIETTNARELMIRASLSWTAVGIGGIITGSVATCLHVPNRTGSIRAGPKSGWGK